VKRKLELHCEIQPRCFDDSPAETQARVRVEQLTRHGVCLTSCMNSVWFGGSAAFVHRMLHTRACQRARSALLSGGGSNE
jgi:hypothetical protein